MKSEIKSAHSPLIQETVSAFFCATVCGNFPREFPLSGIPAFEGNLQTALIPASYSAAPKLSMMVTARPRILFCVVW